jgi:hypothetical protein
MRRANTWIEIGAPFINSASYGTCPALWSNAAESIVFDALPNGTVQAGYCNHKGQSLGTATQGGAIETYIHQIHEDGINRHFELIKWRGR